VLARSEALTRGTGEWQDYKVVFTTGSVMRAVLISIQRQKCATSPCAIFGRAWFDTFLLEAMPDICVQNIGTGPIINEAMLPAGNKRRIEE
jgi:hypothetical protein